MLSGQIVHRDVKGLNILLKEMRGYFETCICDFGAQSHSSSHGQRRGRRRACRQALRGSRTSWTPCPRRASREPLPSCRPSSSRCLLDPAPLHELWRSVGCAGSPRDAKVRRLCVCRHHVGDGYADASVARPRSYGGMRLSGWRVVAVCGIC